MLWIFHENHSNSAAVAKKKNALFKKGSTEGGFVSVCSVEELVSEQEDYFCAFNGPFVQTKFVHQIQLGKSQ